MIITSNPYYFHPEFNDTEVVEYVFYNIGNTKVTIPEEINGNNNDANSFVTDNFVENGILYSLSEDRYVADVTLDEFDDAFIFTFCRICSFK